MAHEAPGEFTTHIPLFLPEPEQIVISGLRLNLAWHNTIVVPVLGGDGKYDHLLRSINSNPEDTRILFFDHPLCPDGLKAKLEYNGFPIEEADPPDGFILAHHDQMLAGRTDHIIPGIFEFIE